MLETTTWYISEEVSIIIVAFSWVFPFKVELTLDSDKKKLQKKTTNETLRLKLYQTLLKMYHCLSLLPGPTIDHYCHHQQQQHFASTAILP